jgi:hypothetical protein
MGGLGESGTWAAKTDIGSLKFEYPTAFLD